MPSEPTEAYVWVWLPGATEPVIAGVIRPSDSIYTFTYGQSYLQHADRIPLYLPELPLESGPIPPRTASDIAGCLADAGPDAWGQRVILNRVLGRQGTDPTDLTRLTYLLESGSDRIGALDFQGSPNDYVPRSTEHASLEELAQSAERVEQGVPLSPELDQALMHGSSGLGGARPKALLVDGAQQLIAKFSSSTDVYPIVKGEFVAMELARRAGLDVASVGLTAALGKDVLLVQRFDRPGDGRRRAMVSALTILELDEFTGARYASYAELADVIRARFTEPQRTLRELFSRITFNILVGNNDDHPRNQAAFWDGSMLTLTPGYDITPQPRSGGEAAQLMEIGRDGWRFSQVAGCVERADVYLLSTSQAREIVDGQIAVINDNWDDVCDMAKSTAVDRSGFWHHQFLNPYALEGY